VWKVDTLYSPPGGIVYDIWGSSPDNVWAVLSGGINNLWHFDGTKWTVWPKRVAPSFYSVFGFSRDNAWLGGGGGNIYHFDGSQWSLAHNYSKAGFDNALIISIWGSSPNNIYAAGAIADPMKDQFFGFLLHYDGKNWRERAFVESPLQFSRVRRDRNGVFVSGSDLVSNPSSFYIYRYSSNALVDVYNGTSNDVDFTSFNLIGTRIHYVIGNSIFKYNDGRMDEWLISPSHDFGFQIYGRHEQDLFLRMQTGLDHFDGTNFQNLFSFENTLFSLSQNAMIFDNDVFFIVNDFNSGSNLIYRGSLTD
jgi:hypothetical protein